MVSATVPASTQPSQNGSSSQFAAKAPPQLHNRTALTQNFENVRNALGAGHNTAGPCPIRKRHASPEMNVRNVRPKLRRSMSVNDMTTIVNITALKQAKRNVLPTIGATTKPLRPVLKVLKPLARNTAASKPTTVAAAKPTINGKPSAKPVPAITKASSAVAAPKGTAKPRIPPYDFKARFNDLNERHKTLREKYDALSENLKEYASLPEQYDECQQKLFQTETELRNVNVQLECLQRQTSADKIKIDSLAEQLQMKTEQYRVCDESNQKLRMENASIIAEVSGLRVTKTELSVTNEALEKELREAKEVMYRFNLERKDLHNTIMDLRGNIRVFCRVRPPLDNETTRNLCAWQYYDDTSLEIGESIIGSSQFDFILISQIVSLIRRKC